MGFISETLLLDCRLLLWQYVRSRVGIGVIETRNFAAVKYHNNLEMFARKTVYWR
jgi:uncharacterized protein (DUF302 family)